MITDAKQKLLDRQAELRALLLSSEADGEPVELDQSRRVGRLSRMDALQGQAMAQETIRRRKGELLRIESALERLAADNFGYCLKCDAEISEKRLELDLSSTLCIECASSR